MTTATNNYQLTNNLRSKNDNENKVLTSNGSSVLVGHEVDHFSNVDDGLTSLSWLQNLNMCMTRLGAPTPPTPPASPLCFNYHNQSSNICSSQECFQSTTATITNNNNNNNTSSSKNNKIINHHHNNHNHIHHHHHHSNISVSESSNTFTLNTNNGKLGKVSILEQRTSEANIGLKQPEKVKKKSNNKRSIWTKSNNGKLKSGVLAINGNNNDNNNNNSNSSHNSINNANDLHQQLCNTQLATATSSSLSSSHPSYQESVDYKLNGNIKPPYSYATLICMAMKANKNKMTLSSIYKWIKENFLYYRNADPSWQNSIRHNLSLNKCFIKIARNKDEPGKGGFWKLDPIYADSLVDGIFKKRRTNNKQPHNHHNNNNNSNNNNNNGNNNRQESNNNGDGDVDGEGNGIGSIKKKFRKKRTPSNDFYIGYIEDDHIQQETPPSSAESYAYKEHKMIDISELNNAISSIDNHCTYTYTFPSANLLECADQSLLQDFPNEVCISHNVNSNDCIIEPDGNDICWNAILTDVDLSDLVDPISYSDSVAQIIHPLENGSNLIHSSNNSNNNNNNNKDNAAQLTAVEPNEPNELTMSSATTLIDDTQLFYPDNTLAFNAQSSQVITATSNVVTCINDTSLTDHWNHWTTYTSTDGTIQLECPTRNGELLLGHMEPDQTDININEINLFADNDRTITYITANELDTSSTNNVKTLNSHSSRLTLNPITQTNDGNTQSPTNYENNNNSLIWDCKMTNMDTTSVLEIDNFNNLDQLNPF